LDGEEEFELGGEFLLGVESVREVDPADAAVGVDGDPQRLDVVAAVGPAREVRKVELNLVPPLIETHGHGADEGLHAGRGLIIGGAEPPPHILVVEHLHLKGEVFLELRGGGGTFLMIITRKGSLIPKVSSGFWGQVMNAVVTFVPIISRTDDWISWSVMRLMCPF
jgi:hypothetical protein